MKISWEQVQAISRMHKETAGETVKARPARRPDAASDDEQSGLLNIVITEVGRLPSVRSTRVMQLRHMISRGEYAITADEIADLFIRRALADGMAR